jgi:hypothetical protein
MRHSALALASAVVLSVGGLSLRAAAQTVAPSSAATEWRQAIGRRVPVDFTAVTAGPAPGFVTPFLPALRSTFSSPVRQGLDMPAVIPQIECRMPTLKGDPAIDRAFVAVPPPASDTTYFLGGVPAPACVGSSR